MLSYTLEVTSSDFKLNDETSISFGQDPILLQCRYARTVSANSDVTVDAPTSGPMIGTGNLTYDMVIVAGALGGTTQVTISPNHHLTGVSPR